MGPRTDVRNVGGARFSCLAGQKEADREFKPMSHHFITNRPTVVFKCAVSESQKSLKVDAKWWIENSEGAVGTVVLVTVSKEERSVCVEKWRMTDIPNRHVTQAEHNPFITRPQVLEGVRSLPRF